MRMRTRRSPAYAAVLGCVLLLTALVAGACGSDGGTTNGGTVKTYTDPEYGFSFDYPADWKLQEGESSEVTAGGSPTKSVGVFDPEGAVADDTYIDLAQTSVYELNVTVDESMMPDIQAEVEQVLASLESQATDLETTEALSEAEVGGVPGFKVTYTFTKGSEPVTSTLYFLFNGSIEYQLTLQAATKNWEANAPVFEALVSSFKPGPTE
jgi:PsbP-like protein